VPSANLLTGLGIDDFFQRTDSSGVRSFVTDILGSAVALTDPNGAIVTTYSYEPFGRASVGGAASTNRFQFTGRENDLDALYYYRSRYYSPTFQRFISLDPIGFAVGETNLYVYAGDDPVRFSDPLGLYLDLNFGGGYGLGVTFGIQIGRQGIYPYIGAAATTPGGGGSLTCGPGEPEPGWQAGAQLQGTPVAYQAGTSLSGSGGAFGEAGLGYDAGASGSLYHLWGPFTPFGFKPNWVPSCPFPPSRKPCGGS